MRMTDASETVEVITSVQRWRRWSAAAPPLPLGPERVKTACMRSSRSRGNSRGKRPQALAAGSQAKLRTHRVGLSFPDLHEGPDVAQVRGIRLAARTWATFGAA